jgi:hypothetical protein
MCSMCSITVMGLASSRRSQLRRRYSFFGAPGVEPQTAIPSSFVEVLQRFLFYIYSQLLLPSGDLGQLLLAMPGES